MRPPSTAMRRPATAPASTAPRRRVPRSRATPRPAKAGNRAVTATAAVGGTWRAWMNPYGRRHSIRKPCCVASPCRGKNISMHDLHRPRHNAIVALTKISYKRMNDTSRPGLPAGASTLQDHPTGDASMSSKSNFAPRLAGFALAALAAAVSGALVSPVASASGFQISENTVKAMGRAYAGREAAGNDASVVMNNPAAMVDFDTYAVQIDATAIDVSTQFHGSGTDAIGQPLSGGDGGNGGGVHGVPAISFIAPIAQNWRLGFGINAPFGLATEYDAGWMGRYQALKTSVKSTDFTGSIGWAISPQFSVGVSVIAQKTTIDLGNAIDLGAVTAAPPCNL